MQLINNVCLLYVLKTAIYQWKWWNEIKISNGLKVMKNSRTTVSQDVQNPISCAVGLR